MSGTVQPSGGVDRSAGIGRADDVGGVGKAGNVGGGAKEGRADRTDVREPAFRTTPRERPVREAPREPDLHDRALPGRSLQDRLLGVGPAELKVRIDEGERAAAARDLSRADAPDDIASQAIDESIEDAQSGDFLAYGGFEPQRLAQYYVQMATGKEPGRANAARMEELASKLVDRILVSGPSDPRSENMRMKLVSEVLDGAEVWMRREKGELRLDFKSGTERTRDFLTERRAELERDLSERLKESVRVGVEMPSE